MQEQPHCDKVLECLTEAGVPEKLAQGIIDILVQAGCMDYASTAKASNGNHSAKVVSLSSHRPPPPASSRFPLIQDTLPTLLLTYEQRIDVVHDRRHRDMYRYARLASANRVSNALILTREQRVL